MLPSVGFFMFRFGVYVLNFSTYSSESCSTQAHKASLPGGCCAFLGFASLRGIHVFIEYREPLAAHFFILILV